MSAKPQFPWKKGTVQKDLSQTQVTQTQVTMSITNASPEVLKLWILWCLQRGYSHQSMYEAGGMGNVFGEIFPDSDIPNSILYLMPVASC